MEERLLIITYNLSKQLGRLPPVLPPGPAVAANPPGAKEMRGLGDHRTMPNVCFGVVPILVAPRPSENKT